MTHGHNETAFAAAKQVIENVVLNGASAAVSLAASSAEAKRELLDRIHRWMEQEPDDLFIRVSMPAGGQTLWRRVRQAMADALLRRGANGGSALNRLIGPKRPRLDSLPDRDLGVALTHLLNGNYVREAAGWLRGADLSEPVRTRLELTRPAAIPDGEAEAREVVTTLCELVEPGAAVFYLDAMEAPGEEASADLTAWLVENTRNAALLCCAKMPVEPAALEWGQELARRMCPISAADSDLPMREAVPLLLRALRASVNEEQVCICNDVNLTVSGEKLRRAGGTLFLRDARLPISTTVSATQQRIRGVEEQGGRFVTVSSEAVATLAALARLYAEAPAHAPDQWLAANVPEPLAPLVQHFAPGRAASNALTPALATLLAERKIVSLDEAAKMLSASREEVEACARRDPWQFAILGGSEPALFQPVYSGPKDSRDRRSGER